MIAIKRRFLPLIALVAATGCSNRQSITLYFNPHWVVSGTYEPVDSLLPGQTDDWCDELLPDEARSLGLTTSASCWSKPRACRQTLTYTPARPSPDTPINEYPMGSTDPFREYTVSRHVTLVASTCAKDQPFEIELEGFYSHQRYEKSRNNSPSQRRFRSNPPTIDIYVDDNGERWSYTAVQEADVKVTVGKKHTFYMDGDYLRTRQQVWREESPSDE